MCVHVKIEFANVFMIENDFLFYMCDFHENINELKTSLRAEQIAMILIDAKKSLFIIIIIFTELEWTLWIIEYSPCQGGMGGGNQTPNQYINH